MNYCRFFSKFATCVIILTAICSAFASAAPLKPKLSEVRNHHKVYDDDVDSTKKQQEYVKALELLKKKEYAYLKNSHWLGGKKITFTPEFYLVWTLAGWEKEEEGQVEEALQFMQKLQPRLRRELGVFLMIYAPNKKQEKKILAAMTKTGVQIPVNDCYPSVVSSSFNRMCLFPSSKAKRVEMLCPFTDLDDSEAADVYISSFEEGVQSINSEFEKLLGETYTSHFAPTYWRSHNK